MICQSDIRTWGIAEICCNSTLNACSPKVSRIMIHRAGIYATASSFTGLRSCASGTLGTYNICVSSPIPMLVVSPNRIETKMWNVTTTELIANLDESYHPARLSHQQNSSFERHYVITSRPVIARRARDLPGRLVTYSLKLFSYAPEWQLLENLPNHPKRVSEL